jgi:hypothetical protein
MLDPQHIPRTLQALIPLAERFGLADDVERERLVRATPAQELHTLVAAVRENDDALDLWLAGPEAAGPEFTDEYVAFSAMRMAADYAA